MSEPLRIVVVDDHPVYRGGMQTLFSTVEDIDVVGVAGSGEEAVRVCDDLLPDVVVMDLNMPSMGGVEATRHIAGIAPLTRVVMLTISDQDNDVMDAILAGACGYLL